MLYVTVANKLSCQVNKPDVRFGRHDPTGVGTTLGWECYHMTRKYPANLFLFREIRGNFVESREGQATRENNLEYVVWVTV